MGYILDPLTARVTLMDKNPIAKVLGPGEYTPEVKGRDRSKEDKKTVPQRLYTCHNSKLDFIQLDNIIYDPDNLNTQQCGQQICNDASLTLWTGETFESGSGLKFSYKSNASENSQEFKIPKYTDTSGLDSDNKHIHYKLSTFPLKISHGQQQRPLKIPIVTLATEPKDPTATEPKDPTATEPKDPTTIPNAVLKSIGPSNAQLATTITARSAAPKDTTVLFLRQKMLLILCSNVIITVWRLPEKYSEECTLLTARWIEAERFSSDTATKSVDERSSSDTTTKSVEECFSSDTITKSIDIKQYEQHQRLFIRDTEHVEHSLLAGLRGFPYDSHEHEFHFTVEGLVMMYIVADDECRKSIAQCLIESINRYQSPEGCVVLWIFKVFNKLSDVKSLELLEKLLTSVLGSEQPQWIPRPDFKWPDQRQPSRESISRILRLSKHSSKRSSKRSPRHEGFKSIELVEIIAPYCFRISREHKDIRLISPITACLPILWRHQHCEVALDLLRKLAYIPMNDGTQLNRIAASPISMRNVVDEFTLLVKETLSDIEESWEYIVENGWTIFTPLGFFTFLVSLLIILLKPGDSQSICDFQHPVVIDYIDLSVKKYYVARFDMLWMSKDLSPSESITGRVDKMTHSWLLAALFMIRHSFIPSHRNIERHELNLDAFDNPAIEALIEYKWNAFGFYFWLLRFLFQCIYYTLVLTVVFVQVYKGQDWIIPLYDTVIVLSAIFLWLEFTQFIEQPWKYITSPYNLFDLFAFIFPMIGCFTARHGGDITTFSFSVIFVFLHFLFELRTNKNVCHYATIIIRIFGELKVFFFIFAGGIIAHAIAILHLLHGCIKEDCAASNSNSTISTSGTSFPYEPISALSATYFFIAGIYDPVSDEFANGDWRFRVMMAMFVLFTVILMLNVLIALINTAFSDGDRTWRNVWLENRLGYIETVENISYRIPGFRQRFHHWFYKEICYQASDDEATAYKKKYFPEDELHEISSVIRDVRSFLKPTNAVSTEFNKGHQTQVPNMGVKQQREADTQISGNGNSSATPSDTQALLLQVQELRTQLTEKQSKLEKQLDEIRDLLRDAMPSKNG
ncbi:hypothetical protein BGX21_003971 [Mortierella sp. AD011]|nr:hypothetical protein BGX21_003971 [Mortierella sp. AD011]